MPMSDLPKDKHDSFSSNPTSSEEPMTPPNAQTSSLANIEEPRSMSDRISGKLPPAMMSDRPQDKCEKDPLSKMFDQA